MPAITLFSLILFLAGLIAGIYSSVVGGGALLLIPVFTLMGTPLIAAIATMRLSATASQLVSVAAFWRKGVIDWKQSLWVSAWCMPGAFIGAHLVLRIDQKILSYTIAILMLVLFFATTRMDTKKFKKPKKFTRNTEISLGVLAFALGVYGGFYGAGFSTIILFMFMMFAGTPVFKSSGDASVVSFFVAATASIPFLFAHLVRWDLFYPVTLGAVIGSWIGVDLASHYGMRWIRPLLLAIVVLSSVKLILFPG
jgi:uncharacterized membrane protein YfcA